MFEYSHPEGKDQINVQTSGRRALEQSNTSLTRGVNNEEHSILHTRCCTTPPRLPALPRLILLYTRVAGAWSPAIPAGERKRRQLQIADELKLGWVAMATNVFFTLCWMRFIDPLVWTYGYFDTHQYTIWWFAGSILPYMFFFDTWFYWTHRWLHESDYLWDKVHRIHHGFKQPTAFAQDAAHPFEALLQGPAG